MNKRQRFEVGDTVLCAIPQPSGFTAHLVGDVVLVLPHAYTVALDNGERVTVRGKDMTKYLRAWDNEYDEE